MTKNLQRIRVLGAVKAVVLVLERLPRASIHQIVGTVDALPAHEVAGAVLVFVTVTLTLAAIFVAYPEFVERSCRGDGSLGRAGGGNGGSLGRTDGGNRRGLRSHTVVRIFSARAQAIEDGWKWGHS